MGLQEGGEGMNKSCRTCVYVVAPNKEGCLCSKHNHRFHAGLEPCSKYRLNPIWVPNLERGRKE